MLSNTQSKLVDMPQFTYVTKQNPDCGQLVAVIHTCTLDRVYLWRLDVQN